MTKSRSTSVRWFVFVLISVTVLIQPYLFNYLSYLITKMKEGVKIDLDLFNNIIIPPNRNQNYENEMF